MRSAAAATALGITLTIAGLSSCASPAPPGFTPGPEPSGTPVFASDDEALAAAEELYGEYQAFGDALGASGWTDPSGFNDYLRDPALTDELEGAEQFAVKGYHQVGSSTFDTVSLQQLSDHGRGAVELTIYLCNDVTGVDVIDADGLSVVSPNRPDRQPLEVEMDDSDGSLKIVRSEVWAGADFC